MEGPLCPSLPALCPVKETLGSSQQAYVIALQGWFEPAIYTPTANSGTWHSKLKCWRALVLYSTKRLLKLNKQPWFSVLRGTREISEENIKDRKAFIPLSLPSFKVPPPCKPKSPGTPVQRQASPAARGCTTAHRLPLPHSLPVHHMHRPPF